MCTNIFSHETFWHIYEFISKCKSTTPTSMIINVIWNKIFFLFFLWNITIIYIIKFITCWLIYVIDGSKTSLSAVASEIRFKRPDFDSLFWKILCFLPTNGKTIWFHSFWTRVPTNQVIKLTSVSKGRQFGLITALKES